MPVALTRGGRARVGQIPSYGEPDRGDILAAASAYCAKGESKGLGRASAKWPGPLSWTDPRGRVRKLLLATGTGVIGTRCSWILSNCAIVVTRCATELT
jgi:hypothetical protein